MLQVKSFRITDDKGVNELLRTYRLAKDAKILISEGVLCVPFEDGEPETPTQKIAHIREVMINMEREKEIVVHSNKVLLRQVDDQNERLKTLTEEFKNAKGAHRSNKEVKDLEARIAIVEKSTASMIALGSNNEHEIRRINLNLEIYEQQIKELSK